MIWQCQQIPDEFKPLFYSRLLASCIGFILALIGNSFGTLNTLASSIMNLYLSTGFHHTAESTFGVRLTEKSFLITMSYASWRGLDMAKRYNPASVDLEKKTLKSL